ncbi:hypothetical protein [Paenibacillus sp. Y412MC10]|uniref:hypothetical protein n=1 Tax=Geobacillus sp. (strain Y412MC10) TaxID=481743 RepID=UPI001642F271|nr:hypothetical protein [Paenibacillus sp. Y412MC10]
MENKMNVVVIEPKNLNLEELAKQLGSKVITLNLNELKQKRFNPFEPIQKECPEE